MKDKTMASPMSLSHDTLADLVERIAKQVNASPEDVLEDLAYRYLYETPLEALENEQILALAELRLSGEQQQSLSSLLDAQRENRLDTQAKAALESFMKRYGTMQIRKAQAMAEAVKRGLRSEHFENWPEHE